jgi:hypothetical protein
MTDKGISWDARNVFAVEKNQASLDVKIVPTGGISCAQSVPSPFISLSLCIVWR